MELCSEITVGYVGSMAKEYVSNGVPLLRSLNIKPYRLDFNDIKYISEDFNKKISKSALFEDDVVIVRTGKPGTSCVIPSGFVNLNCSDLVIVRPNKNKIDPHYLSFYFNSIAKRHVDNQLVGAIQQHFNIGSAKEMIINIPNLYNQKSIAKVLNDLNAKIELNNRINSELEAMAKTLYDYWFVQFDFPISAEQAAALGQPELKGKPYKSSGGKMVWNKELKREIPEGWEVKKLSKCVECIIDHRGKTPKKLGGDWSFDDDSIIALSAKIVKGGKLVNLAQANKVSRELFDKWMPKKLRDGDVLMTSEAPAGEFYFIHGFTEYCMSQRLFALRSDKSILESSYFYYELSKGHGFSQIQGSLSGSTVFGIRQDVLRTIEVLIPTIGIQKKFDEIVLPQLKQIKQLDLQNQQLASLRDWLLPMLMNGQVKVGAPASKTYAAREGMDVAAEGEVRYEKLK